MLPEEWDKKLVDMNVGPLTDKDIRWADYVFISAMAVQRASVKEVIARCQKLALKLSPAGLYLLPIPMSSMSVDHLVLGEAEITLRSFPG